MEKEIGALTTAATNLEKNEKKVSKLYAIEHHIRLKCKMHFIFIRRHNASIYTISNIY